MINPFKNLPFNTGRMFTSGVAASGCEIWIPVTGTQAEMEIRRKELLAYLQSQIVDQPLPPTRA
jgi:hypothetical protein